MALGTAESAWKQGLSREAHVLRVLPGSKKSSPNPTSACGGDAAQQCRTGQGASIQTSGTWC